MTGFLDPNGAMGSVRCDWCRDYEFVVGKTKIKQEGSLTCICDDGPCWRYMSCWIRRRYAQRFAAGKRSIPLPGGDDLPGSTWLGLIRPARTCRWSR